MLYYHLIFCCSLRSVVECINWISVEEYFPTASVLDMALNYLMVTLKSWNSGECGVPLHYHYPQIQSGPAW